MSTNMPPTRRGALPPAVIPQISPTAQDALAKRAALTKTAPGGAGQRSTMASVQVVRSAPKTFSPMYENSNLNLPRDLRTLNAWNRHYYNTNPLVRNAINLHATYPISKFQLSCEDHKIKQFFEDQFDHINMSNLLHAISLEYWKLGEAIPYLELDQSQGIWSHGFCHNADFIRVEVSPLAKDPIITLIPDDQLKRVVNNSTAADAELRRQLPPELITLIKRGMNIPLNNFNVSHLRHLSSDYDVRGTSLITCVFKDLMLYDKMREAEYVQADDLMNPITHVKLGDPNGTWKPDDSDISDMRRAIEEAMYDLDYKLITHGGVSIERVGAAGAVLDTSRMWEMTNKNILLGLMVPEELLSGQGASYASATVSLEVLRSRYDRFRNTIEQWIYRKVLEPIAKIQDFYKWENGRRKLVVPKIVWNKMNLRDVETYINTLTNLIGEEPGSGVISRSTLVSLLDLDPQAMEVEKRREMIDAAIRAKETEALAKMDLAELQSLDPTKAIIDRKPNATSPAAQGEGMPGAQDDALGGGMGGGGAGGGGLDLGSMLGGDPGGGGAPGGGEPPAPTPDIGGPGA